MNQKEIDDIARIIKQNKMVLLTCDDTLDRISLDLADYFEKEDKGYELKKSGSGVRYDVIEFDRKKFLKDCGVEVGK